MFIFYFYKSLEKIILLQKAVYHFFKKGNILRFYNAEKIVRTFEPGADLQLSLYNNGSTAKISKLKVRSGIDACNQRTGAH